MATNTHIAACQDATDKLWLMGTMFIKPRAEADKHILPEKPIGPTAPEGREIIDSIISSSKNERIETQK